MPMTITVGNQRRVPKGLWNELLRDGKLGAEVRPGPIRMTAKYLSIPNMAGELGWKFLSPSQNNLLIPSISSPFPKA